MRKHIELKRFDQGTALTTGKLALGRSADVGARCL